MAKRKRLTPPLYPQDPSSATTEVPAGGPPEDKSMFPSYPLGVALTSTSTSRSAPAPSRSPIAQVAGDAAAQSGLDELADEMYSIRAGGRLVTLLALSDIAEDHMVRDRMVNDLDEMASLKASLIARGQQTPVEVVALEQGGYGLISGWRRLHAFRALHEETGEDRFGKIQALVKPIDSVSDGYIAMVEENEIRSDLSFYERAHLVAEAVQLGIYPTTARAISILFANAPSAKRSKIGSFVKLHKALGGALQFPATIPERLGLTLANLIEQDPAVAVRLKDVLRKTPPKDARAERAALERALRKTGDAPAAPVDIIPGVRLETRKGRAVLSGKGVTEDLQRDLRSWLAERA
jgi:ParB family chromosome partitioning protein